jgi:cytidylate kinase
MKTQSRTLEKLVEQQLGKWNFQFKERKKEKVKPRPIISISRETGAGGSKICKRLAELLDMDLIGSEIIQQVAESAQMSAKVIESLDEKDVSARDNWLESLFETRHLWPDVYLFHLTKVIGTIGKHGNAIVVGRGAHYILPPEDTFRVKIIAPLDIRIKNISREHNLSTTEAEKYVIKTDSGREAFVKKYFHADWTDVSHYDLVLNTRVFSVDAAAETIKLAFLSWPRAAKE